MSKRAVDVPVCSLDCGAPVCSLGCALFKVAHTPLNISQRYVWSGDSDIEAVVEIGGFLERWATAVLFTSCPRS